MIKVSALKNEADKLASKYPQTYPVLLDISRSQDELEKLIKNHQIVIRLKNYLILNLKSIPKVFPNFSLLPYTYHPTIAELCIKYKVDMVTASYLSKAMQDLNDK